MALSPQQLDAQTEATMKQVAIIIIIYYKYPINSYKIIKHNLSRSKDRSNCIIKNVDLYSSSVNSCSPITNCQRCALLIVFMTSQQEKFLILR